MTQHKVCYFLGANSPAGFYSLYDQLIDPAAAEDIFILKGGPGCGKSSLIRKVGAALEEKGIPVEYIQCSGDPDSLDGILVPALAAAIVDGTAPHGRVSNVHTGHPRFGHVGQAHAHIHQRGGWTWSEPIQP